MYENIFIISAIFTKGRNVCDFLFAPPPPPPRKKKWSTLKKMDFSSRKANFYFQEVTPSEYAEKGCLINNGRVRLLKV